VISIHPGSLIPDPTIATKEKRGKIGCPTFFCSDKYHKTENYLFLNRVQKKIGANSQRITVLFIQKIVTKLSKI
jgi:hypothetical protein